MIAPLFLQSLFGLSPGALPTLHGHTSQPATYSVGVMRCTFVDRSRGVLNYSTNPPTTLSTSRTVITEIRYPTTVTLASGTESSGPPPAQRSGGFPMIVFAHGYDVTPDTYASLLDAWVKAGFVVAAPLFPDENKFEVAAQHQANTENDLWNEPADIAFVAGQMVKASAASSPRCPTVRGLVNPSQLGLAGHSDGATAVAMLSYARGNDPQGVSYQTLRAGLSIRASVVMSGKEDGVNPYEPLVPDPALLVVQSAADQCNPVGLSMKLYRDLHQSKKWFLELRTAHHLPPFDGVDIPAFGVVARTSIRFFQITLQGAVPTSGLTAYGSQLPRVAHMFYAGKGPDMANPPTVPSSCGPN